MATERGWDTRYHLVQLQAMDKNNIVVKMAKVLTEDNPILRDLPIMPGNEQLGHTGVRTSSLPTAQIIKVGAGWDASKAEWNKYTERISMFKDRIDIPREALMLQPNPTQKRMTIRDLHIEGFGQSVANHLVYGTSVVDNEKFNGLAVRYNSPDATDPISVTNGDYGVYDMAGTGSDTSSIWLCQWGPERVTGLHPLNAPMMGLNTEDVGLVYVTAENSKERRDWRTELEWNLGLDVADYRCVARIRNIESALSAIDTDLWKTIIRARNNFKGQAPVWMYVNGAIFTQLDIMTADKQNVRYSSENPWGTPQLMFRDMVIGKCDCLSETEDAVAAI